MKNSGEADRVDIVMATYNGAKYLHQQVNSILDQTYLNWHLHIGDDKSKDGTPDLLEIIQKEHPQKITVYPFKDNVGVIENFSRLLELSDAEYVMFCDQDDIWFPDKIETTLKKMKALEEQWGNDIPLLIHTDMKVVDEDLNLIDSSHRKRQGINPVRSGKLNAALVQSGMWGCTLMFNRKLIDLATPIPLEGMVHDAWLALIASGCGKIDFVKEPTMLYRQHANNWAGSLGSNYAWFVKYVLKNPDFQKHSELRFMRCMVRGYIFYKRYGTFLNEDQRKMLEAFIDLKYQLIWKELYLRWKYGFWNHGFWPNVGLILATIRMGKADPRYRQRF